MPDAKCEVCQGELEPANNGYAKCKACGAVNAVESIAPPGVPRRGPKRNDVPPLPSREGIPWFKLFLWGTVFVTLGTVIGIVALLPFDSSTSQTITSTISYATTTTRTDYGAYPLSWILGPFLVSLIVVLLGVLAWVKQTNA